MFSMLAIIPTIWAFIWWLSATINGDYLNGWFIGLATLSLFFILAGQVEKVSVLYDIQRRQRGKRITIAGDSANVTLFDSEANR